jgi:hypothetical protein
VNIVRLCGEPGCEVLIGSRLELRSAFNSSEASGTDTGAPGLARTEIGAQAGWHLVMDGLLKEARFVDGIGAAHHR